MSNTPFADTVERRIPRAQLAAQLRRHGRSDQEANETADLVMQAVRKAFEAIETTAHLASHPSITIDVLTVGSDLMKVECQTLAESLQAAAKATGMEFQDATIIGRKPRYA